LIRKRIHSWIAFILLLFVLMSGIAWGIVEQQYRLYYDFEVFQEFEGIIPQNAQVILNYSLPAIHHSLKRPIVNHNGSIEGIKAGQDMINMAIAKDAAIYFLCVYDERFKNPRIPYTKFLLKRIFCFSPIVSKMLTKIGNISIDSDRNLCAYLKQNYALIKQGTQVNASLFRIK
ncbi:hypothetical protein ACFL3D_04740, partial [Candidatus Omnitrophota bacterium]